MASTRSTRRGITRGWVDAAYFRRHFSHSDSCARSQQWLPGVVFLAAGGFNPYQVLPSSDPLARTLSSGPEPGPTPALTLRCAGSPDPTKEAMMAKKAKKAAKKVAKKSATAGVAKSMKAGRSR